MQADLEQAGVPIFKTMIRRSAGFAKAALEGVVLRDLTDSRGRIAWNDYAALGREVMEVLNAR